MNSKKEKEVKKAMDKIRTRFLAQTEKGVASMILYTKNIKRGN